MAVRETPSNSFTFTMVNEYGQGAVVKIESVFPLVYHVACRQVLSNGSFQEFIYARFSESVIWEIHKL